MLQVLLKNCATALLKMVTFDAKIGWHIEFAVLITSTC